MTERFFDVTYNRDEGLTVRIKPAALQGIPEPAREHFRAATKEALLALRSLVDDLIARAEAKPAGARKARKVEVKQG